MILSGNEEIMTENETWNAFWNETEEPDNPKQSPLHQYLSDKRRVVAAQVQAILSQKKKKPTAKERIAKEKIVKETIVRDRSGFVYLIRSDRGFYKIGHAKVTQKRMDRFHVKIPFEIELEHVIECVDRIKAERFLHKRYNSKRGNGEWFALTPEDVEWIKGIAHDEQFDYPR